MSSTTSTETEGYNGWANYPTWCVNLWLGNDAETHDAALHVTQLGLDYADDHPNVPSVWTQEQSDRFGVAGALKTWVTEDLVPDLGASFPADLLGWAMDHVDWDEIATAWIEKVRDV